MLVKPEEKSQWICILGASKSQVPFIKAAHRLGFKTIVFDQNPLAPGAKIATRFYPISTHSINRICDKCLALDNKLNIKGVITYSAYKEPLYAVANICEKLNLPSYPAKTVEIVTDKVKMKKHFSNFDIPTPKWIATDKLTNVVNFFKGYEFPIIMKPSSGVQGSLGISLAKNEKEIKAMFPIVSKFSKNNIVILERFYKGHTFSIDGFATSKAPIILAISEKFNLGPKLNFITAGFSMGKSVELYRKKNMITELTSRIVKSVGIKNSFFSIDILITDKSNILVLECGILLDAKIDRLLDFAGVDVYTMMLRFISGQVKIEEPRYQKGYGLCFMFAEKDGYLVKRIYEKAYENTLIEWEIPEGGKVQKPRSIADTIGWIITESNNSKSAYRKARMIYNSGPFQVVESIR